jgi:hypothetical protein
MQVEHRLSGPRAVVDHRAVSLRFQSSRAGELCRNEEKMAQQRRVFRLGLLERGQVFAGNHQQVDRRLRVNVCDRHGSVVFVNDLGGSLVVNDSAEKAIRH